MTESRSAQELFRAAYENRYTWDANFPGYTADITLTQSGPTGDRTDTAKARVTADLKAEVTDIDNDEAKKAIHGQLWEIAVHRVRRSFEQTHGENTFEYGQTASDGTVAILMGGKAKGDRYAVRNNEVVLVHRHIHGTVVTIHTKETYDTGEGYLSQRYDSVYHDPQTGEQRGGFSEFTDRYTQVGDYHILTQRTIATQVDGQTITQDFVFSNIQLLTPVAAPVPAGAAV